MGDDSRGQHTRRSHDAGLHLLEPMDRHGNAPSILMHYTPNKSLHVHKKLLLNFGLLVVANPWICCEDT